MIKLILFSKRKQGLSHEEFKNYYESNHAPLAKKTLPWMVDYRRNYLTPVNGEEEGASEDFSHLVKGDYDVVTEFYFANEKDFSEMTAAMAENDGIAKILAEDEEKFMDRSSMRFYLSEEHISDLAR